MFKNKIVMITGGTGSFGHALLERLLASDIGEIRIFSRDEKKQDDMRHYYNENNPQVSDKISYYIGDVRDLSSVKNAVYGVDYIFHAAALKQIPSCEFFPMEAVKTNIIGTDNILTAAIEVGAKKIVCLSTDKAAYPVNAMGTSKAMMEKIFIARSRTTDPQRTAICGTRYGNVMCSRGSVIPLFIEQIKRGLPITVTDPQMTRFIMSLDEAIGLVLYAFQNGKSGDIMIKKSPSCYIGDLAQALIEFFHANTTIQIIDIRHGEKIYEVLMTKEEAVRAKDEGSFFRVFADKKTLEKGSQEIAKVMEYTSINTQILDIDGIKEKLLTIPYIQKELASKKE